CEWSSITEPTGSARPIGAGWAPWESTTARSENAANCRRVLLPGSDRGGVVLLVTRTMDVQAPISMTVDSVIDIERTIDVRLISIRFGARDTNFYEFARA